MNELIQAVSQKTGLSESMARTAVDTVVGYLKQRLPGPVAGQLDKALAGGSVSGQMGDIAKDLGGMLGDR